MSQNPAPNPAPAVSKPDSMPEKAMAKKEKFPLALAILAVVLIIGMVLLIIFLASKLNEETVDSSIEEPVSEVDAVEPTDLPAGTYISDNYDLKFSYPESYGEFVVSFDSDSPFRLESVEFTNSLITVQTGIPQVSASEDEVIETKTVKTKDQVEFTVNVFKVADVDTYYVEATGDYPQDDQTSVHIIAQVLNSEDDAIQLLTEIETLIESMEFKNS